MRVGLVVPHIFMNRAVLPEVIFSPAGLALDLADGLQGLGCHVTLFSPGPVNTSAANVTADLRYFEAELKSRGDTYVDLLKKHPLTFITLARQVQGELIAKAFEMANNGGLDIVHVYTNEEELGLTFARFCRKPVVFTHHDPFNFLVRYKNFFPKYQHLNWLSLSLAQRRTMPAGTNWVGNIYHGLPKEKFQPVEQPTSDYIAYIGRIIQPKGVHLAVAAAREAGMPLKIAGKHYAGSKDAYWRECIAPHIGNTQVEYLGFIKDDAQKQAFLGNAAVVVIPSLFEEPFGMVAIEALACGTPVVALDSGALPEIVRDGAGLIAARQPDETATANALANAIKDARQLSRLVCRQQFEARFTLERMCREHIGAYRSLIKSPDRS